MLPNNFKEWCEGIFDHVHEEYDLWYSFDDLDEGILDELESIYKTEIDVPYKGGKEIGIALDHAMQMAITLLVENEGEGEDQELLDIDNHIARMIARKD